MIGDIAPEGASEVPTGAAPDPTEAAREEFLRQLPAAAEQGTLDATEYAARVRAIDAAPTVADMAAVVARSAPDPVSPAAPGAALDPVDLARMMAPPSKDRRRSERSRYTALIALVVLFALLLAAGLFLASHVHTGAGVVTPLPAGVAASGLVVGAPLA